MRESTEPRLHVKSVPFCCQHVLLNAFLSVMVLMIYYSFLLDMTRRICYILYIMVFIVYYDTNYKEGEEW